MRRVKNYALYRRLLLGVVFISFVGLRMFGYPLPLMERGVATDNFLHENFNIGEDGTINTQRSTTERSMSSTLSSKGEDTSAKVELLLMQTQG